MKGGRPLAGHREMTDIHHEVEAAPGYLAVAATVTTPAAVPATAPPPAEAPAPTIAASPRFGAATPVVVTAGVWIVASLLWWLLASPRWQVFDASPAAISALLFWTILSFIFTGFTFAGWPFSKLHQPWSGLAMIAFNVATAFGAVWLFSFVLGSWDPTFSHSAAGGAGFTATAFVVLIGFYAYALVAASWGGYPFEQLGQPLTGVASFFLAAFLTTAGVVVLVYPNFSAALAKDAPLALPAATGWVYSSIVVVILAAMLWQNWPWSLLANRHLRALAAAAVTLGGGVAVAWAFRGIVGALTPTHIEKLPAFSRDLEAAQLGVCFSLWGLTWGLVWGARPTRWGTAVNRLAATAIVTALSVLTYWAFVNFAAVDIYHFPAVADGNYGGSPLLFMDWVIMALLWYAVSLGGYGSTRREVTVPEAPV